jgi:hypothetical protein
MCFTVLWQILKQFQDPHCIVVLSDDTQQHLARLILVNTSPGSVVTKQEIFYPNIPRA